MVEAPILPETVHKEVIITDQKLKNTIQANNIKTEDFDIEADKNILTSPRMRQQVVPKHNASFDLRGYMAK